MPNKFSKNDIQFMRRAITLAARARGQTSPNPLVGALLVKNGIIVGHGYHSRAGQPHAEIVALNKAKHKANGSTLYINLEPCCHHGKTPPCTDAIIRAKVDTVIAAIKDPNPRVAGKGFAKLKRAGILVKVGLLAPEARRLNEAFIHFHKFGLPFVTLKWAMTLDGRTSRSDGKSRWITNPESRRYAHKLRSFSDAILIGIDTAIHDNPALSIRIAGFRGRQPIRIIVDSQLKIPENALCISDTYRQSTIIATTRNADKRKIETLRSNGCNILLCRKTKNGISMPDLLSKLANESVQSILVEGGRKISGSLLRDGLVNKIVAFISPKIIGGDTLTSPIAGWEAPSLHLFQLKNIQIKKFGQDICILGYPPNPYPKEKI